MPDYESLSNILWLQALRSEEQERLRADSDKRNHRAGEVIFSPTPDPESVYLLEQGLARIYRISREGLETTFGYVAPGELFGELPGFGDYPRESFAQAVEPSVVWRIPLPSFRDLISKHPGLVVDVTKQIGERLKRIETRVENLVFRNVRSRVALILLELLERLGLPDANPPVIQTHVTQAEIATLVGSTRQSVNQCLRELSEEGLVGRRGRKIVLFDPQALRRLADGATG